MPVDHGLDLLGMDLEAADIDDAAPPARKEQPLAARLDDVAGIDEAVVVRQRARPCPT